MAAGLDAPTVAISDNRTDLSTIEQLSTSRDGLLGEMVIELGALHDPEG